MSEYKHGNWYCKPANNAEAREIVERAVASGAELYETVGISGIDKYEWNLLEAWGVIDGRTCTAGADKHGTFRCATQYTIEQIRKLFPLPGERTEQGWNGEGLPQVGWHGEITWGRKATWYECVICPGCVAYKHPSGRWITDELSTL